MQWRTRLDVTGGEPFFSRAFREFIREMAKAPGLPLVGVITNGLFLTPEFVGSLPRLPFRGVTISLNAATPETYHAVNRGARWAKVQRNIEALLEARRYGKLLGELVFSMVVIKMNVHEVEAFAKMAIERRVGVRFMLPIGNRNGQSILTEPQTMLEAARRLERASMLLCEARRESQARQAITLANIIRTRLEKDIIEPLASSEPKR